MHRTASISAFDVLDTMHVTVTIRDWDFDASERPTPEFHTATTVPSDGADTPQEWLRDVLVGLLESL